jgi:hypothetical protein
MDVEPGSEALAGNRTDFLFSVPSTVYNVSRQWRGLMVPDHTEPAAPKTLILKI